MTPDYNSTLNLPKTDFPMRAGLAQSEPVTLSRWEKDDTYAKLMQLNADKPKFILHDGPPYANGDIHMGTALNKTLKDFIIRYKNMSGFLAPYVPGWDTHGLPTELKARKQAGISSNKDISPLEIRKMCKEYTLSYLDDQREQFKRLGGIGEWENPYITLLPEFESKQIEIFSEMATKGYIYKGLKPVYWCPDCKTALAEAEIEYSDDPCFSVYVKFRVASDKGLFTKLGADLSKTYFLIWTTTTWTLPGNVAICVGPRYIYNLVKANDEYLVIAKELTASVLELKEITEYEILGEFSGAELEMMEANHPFLDRNSLVILGDYVTLESGTGCVHIAPGHGVDDYEVAKKYKGLDIIVPVDDNGVLTNEAGQFEGLSTEKAGKAIADYLNENGYLFKTQKIIHQYPHCWRCKSPILSRATKQWFCSVDSFKKQALDEIEKVEWIPAWGKDRISSMVEDRKDWCISRQRKWGVPIPIFYCDDCKKPIINKEIMQNVADIFKIDGSDAWYTHDTSDFIPENFTCSCGSKHFIKETDIMDVWFDSGVSHAAVCDARDYLRRPADVYLEGGDQYRGWFQSSLLTSVATYGDAPYRTVITHGMVVDGEGKKMSKSIGNTVAPKDVIRQYGADVLRLWVASSDYHADIRLSDDGLKQLSEAYRKIRNTARFILGNISDFEPDTNMVAFEDMQKIDKWALIKLNEVIEKVTNAYDKYEFHVAFHAIHNFCVVDLSNFYLDIIKDRLYVNKADNIARRAAQSAMYIILNAVVRLVSPILCFTSDEIWQFMPHQKSDNKENIVFNAMPKVNTKFSDDEILNDFNKILELRDIVKKALEISRANKEIGSSLEANVLLHCNKEVMALLSKYKDNLSTIFITSNVELVEDITDSNFTNGLSCDVVKAKGSKCIRCWVYSETVGQNENHPDLCKRCSDILEN
ncbi:MAG: isoleucine--tRNA ligase [Clostridia bacterium]